MTALTRSEYFRFRTGTSGLSDDELLLLDLFFDGETYPLGKGLYGQNFSSLANLPFSHGFSDDHVRLLLRRWQELGWLTDEDDYFDAEVGPCYTLTPAGGAVWEAEWNPPWPLYCVNPSRGPSRFGRRTFHAEKIVSCSHATAEAFFRTCLKCHWMDGTVSRTARSWKTLRSPHKTFIPWKVFPQVFELRFYVYRSVYVPTDWDLYEKEKRWWLSPYDLAKRRLEGSHSCLSSTESG